MAAKAKAAAIGAKAARIEQRVRKHHETGRLANKAQAERGISTTAFAEKQGLDPGTLRRWKMFAKLYSSESVSKRGGLSQLDELCMLRRPNGLPLHWGFVPYLTTIKNAKKRQEIAERAAANGWSPARLHAEIRQKEKRPSGHGRAVELPAAPVEGLQLVLREGHLWLSRSKKLITRLCSGEPVTSGSLTRDAKHLLDKVAKLFTNAQIECARFGEILEAAKRSPPKPREVKRRRGQNHNARTRQRQTR